eukprot:Colp12_sorted_trinity150504_noHs@19167
MQGTSENENSTEMSGIQRQDQPPQLVAVSPQVSVAATPEELRAAAERLEQRTEEEEQAFDIEEMKYGAQQVLSLIIPVTLCMVIVIATIRSIQYYAQSTGGQYLYAFAIPFV